MANLIRIIFFLTCCISFAEAQVRWCDLDNRLAEIKENGAYDIFLQQLNVYHDQHQIRPRSQKWMQVVVHIVTPDPQSISIAQVVQQIDVLNNDFAKMGENILKLNDEFESLATDTEIRFCLASTDPDGNPTNGITYTITDQENIALERDMNGRYVLYYDQLGGKTGWDPERYINIWVAEFGNGILGYASLPGTAPYPEETGLVIDPNNFGAFGNGQPYNDRGHTLTHEMGHYFGLLHIWGDDDDSCSDSDEVEDTPNAQGPYLGCPAGVQTSCGVSNMYENFMDLTDDRCLAAFTHGQAMRMHATIDLFYPDLDTQEPCHRETDSFDEWWDQLVWSYDASSKEYVLYHPGIYSGNYEIDIFSADGRRIARDHMVYQQSFLIDPGTVPGIYFVRISDGRNYHIRKVSVY